jgi:hypothetical protein
MYHRFIRQCLGFQPVYQLFRRLHRCLLYWYRRFIWRYPFPSSSSRLQFGSLLQLNILNILIMPLLIAYKYILSPQIWRLPWLLRGSTYTTSLAALYDAISRENNRDQCSETMEGPLDLVLELWLKVPTGGLKCFYVIFLWKNLRGFHTCARDFFTSHTFFMWYMCGDSNLQLLASCVPSLPSHLQTTCVIE